MSWINVNFIGLFLIVKTNTLEPTTCDFSPPPPPDGCLSRFARYDVFNKSDIRIFPMLSHV